MKPGMKTVSNLVVICTSFYPQYVRYWETAQETFRRPSQSLIYKTPILNDVCWPAAAGVLTILGSPLQFSPYMSLPKWFGR